MSIKAIWNAQNYSIFFSAGFKQSANKTIIMRILIVGIFVVFMAFSTDSIAGGSRNQLQNARNIILNEQELKFAGTALRTVLSSNVNSYVSFVCY